ncbi:hypothetical protein QQ045_027334 [Rhodiola kirilowii]
METKTSILLLILMLESLVLANAQLVENFYSKSCPDVESIVQKAVYNNFLQTFATIPGTLRLFQHDCFVDVKGPNWNVELGRRDGLVSSKSHAYGKLPHPDFTLADLNAMFGANKLTQTDMIALSGAHTIGFSHCRFFADRINSTPVDPTLNASYAAQLQNVCPVNVDPLLVVDMDPSTPRRFDNSYFQALVQRKGLFKSDSVLFEDEMTRGTVTKFAQDADAFFKAFVEAMLKLGRVGVKTGSQGEIRRDCSSCFASSRCTLDMCTCSSFCDIEVLGTSVHAFWPYFRHL